MPELSDRFASLSRTRSPDLWPEIEDREPGRPGEPSSGRRLVVALAAFVIAIAGIGLAGVTFGGSRPGVVSGTAETVNGPIYFRVGGADGGSRIESIEADGTGRHVVFPEDSPVHYDRLSFSPDGTRIAFDNFLEGEYGIETANPDGSEIVRLTDGVNDSWASWSPDGTKILFSSTRYDPSIEQCLPGFPHEHGCPTDIYVMNAEGSNVVRLTDDPASEYQPVWSPDGERIAFARSLGDPQLSHPAIFTMDPDGTDVRQTSSADGGSDFWPSWSPDGSTIVFAAIRNEDWGIWVVDADGSNEHMILGGTGAGYVDNPVWSPDGNLIAFVGNLKVDDYNPEDALYVMQPDGTDVRPIAAEPSIGVAGDIAWQPIPALSESLESPRLPAADPHITASIPVGPLGNTSALLYAEGSVWVAASFVDGGGGIDDAMLFRVDASTNEIVAEIPLEGAPTWTSGGGGLAYGFGSVWVAAYGQVDGASQAAVQRVDPASNRVIATISLGGTWGADVEVDETGVWAAYFGKEHAGVSRIDPTMDAVVADVQLPSGYVRRITVADGSVVATELEWSGNEGSPSEGPCMVLTAIDPVTATIGVREPVDPPCGTVELIEWNGQIWASGASLQRVDPITARLIGEPVAFDLERFPRSFVLAIGNEVWFGAYPGGNGNRQDRVARLDPATGTIEYFIEAGGIDAAFAPDTRTIWILEYDGTLTRVDLNGR
jgi:hypothetical protein